MERLSTLVFDEYPDDEIVVLLSPVPMAAYLDVLVEFDRIRKGGVGPEDLLAFFRKFASVGLRSWTFPEPADADGMLARDINLAIAIVGQWITEVRDVPIPLPLTPSPGTTSTRKARNPAPLLGPS